MSRALLVIALVGCKDKAKQPPPSPPVVIDGGTIDWTARCAETLTVKQSPVRRLSAIIEGCQPCGDWKPLLDWNTPRTEGGPTEDQIIERMNACKGFCTNDAKMQFLGYAADMRGKPTQRPWRSLGEKCGEAVSAVPDTRFMSAPYFALDRIGRAAAADPKLAALLGAIELPLPLFSISGVGFELPDSPAMKPDPGRFALTVSLQELRLASIPNAKLGDNGVRVQLGGAPYPGEPVTLDKLAALLDAMTGSSTGQITLIAPAAMPAQRLVEVVAAAKQHPLLLAAASSGAPKGWTLPGIVPVALDGQPAKYVWKLDANVEAAIAGLKTKPAEAFDHPKIEIAKDATVAHLAKLLGALALRDARSAALTNAPK